MVWILIRLKIRLLRNSFRTSAGLGLVLFTILAAITSFAVTVLVRSATVEALALYGGLLSGVVTLGWALVPLLFGASDEMVDTTRLASFPLTGGQLAPGMAAAALTGPGPICAAVPLVAFALRSETLLAKLMGLAAAFVMLFLAVGLSRLLLTGLGAALRKRRSRDLATVLAGLGAGMVGIAAQLSSFVASDLSLLERASRVLSFTPFGWPGDALGRLAQGEIRIPAIEIAGSAALAAIAVMAWVKVLDRSLTEVNDGIDVQELEGHLLVGRASDKANRLIHRAVLAKELRYMRRHPRYRVQVVSQAVVLIVGGAPFLTAVVQRDPSSVVLGGLPGLTAGVASANLLGTDGRSLWGEMLALDSLAPVLRGRAFAFVLLGMSGALLVTFGVAAYTGGWQHIPTALASGLGFALTGAGIGTFVSTLAPTPFPDEDNPNPFATGAIGEGCLNGVVTIVGVLTGLLISAPVLLGLAKARESASWAAAVIVLAPIYGALIFWFVSAAAAKRADRIGPDMVTAMSS